MAGPCQEAYYKFYLPTFNCHCQPSTTLPFFAPDPTLQYKVYQKCTNIIGVHNYV